ncbi:MAG TPA: ABC transporter permease [Candidatus Thiothrix moscowensis]|uniref:ABC transporter permease n=1 Tax=unclassified Thiothrix TaxID=2636184 RepID=UPI0025FF311C|nr:MULTISPECIES: ABC transporter permease [unclassified Thiothrix]HRJ53176.1 ABC transporter permease [Candidatus Thiothrix moscowensis]HRJ93254.1 ABC transporter permease [Candidatus Thiothrix moscowensis]
MLTYLLRRLLLMLPTLLGITIVVFSVMVMSPGGISAQTLVEGSDMKPQEKQALLDYYNKRYGLDQPPPIQYLRWLNNVSPVGFTQDEEGAYTGFSFSKGMDLGISFMYGRPVGEILGERIPITLLLNVITLPLIYVIAIVLGVKAATDRGGRFDVGSSVSMLALWSAPTMLVGVLLLGFFANVQYVQWFPTAGISSRAAQDMPFLPHWDSLWDVLKVFGCMSLGMVLAVTAVRWARLSVWWLGSLLLCGGVTGIALGMQFAGDGFVRGFLFDRLWHLFLPIVCLSYGGFAALAKLTRTSVLENLHADYARTARAKGLAEEDVLWKHVFRNSLLPLITVSAGLLPSLLAGSLIVENIFSINGMGQLAVEAVKGRDREMVLSITWVSGFLTLVGYLIADFCYTLVDPRVTYD